MSPADLPVVRAVVDAGPDDRVFDALLLVGPAILLLVVLAGRSPVTTGLAVAYLLALVAAVVYRAVT